MNFFSILYNLFIGPLELFFEIIYVLAYKVIGNYGLSIIVLSLVMNFLVLPLYKRADAMQEEQRETEKKLKKWVTHIKKSFKGDERFMMLQTYYRQNNYKPTSILKGSVSLLLEIPFFIAAYNFLSHAGVFNGVSFGPLQDLGSPDGLIKIGSLSINLLPILMTAINIISSAIYTKGLPASSKVQLYGMAGIFLVLLYKSPSALVFYWTLNNLFSLVKNVFYKLKNPKFVLGIISSIVGIVSCILGFLLLNPIYFSLKKKLFIIFIALLMQIPLILVIAKRHLKIKKNALDEKNSYKPNKSIFFLGVLFLTLLIGFLIPSSVINSSPEEFMNRVTYANPVSYIFKSLITATGYFIIWFSIFYFLSDNKGKHYIELAVWCLALLTTIDYMCFGKNLSNLSPYLVYDSKPCYSIKLILTNLLILVVASIFAYLLWTKKIGIVKIIYCASIFGFLGMSIFNCINISSVIKNKSEDLQINVKDRPTITLSSENKNVIVIMMDRAIGTYVPFIMREKPELQKQFAGFTYYPNTVSFGPFTNFGTPGLYGGYEYTPEEINKRDKESLESKQNEALRVMPVIFDEYGFDVTVCDPTYAGYSWIPDLTIYNDHPDIKKYITMGNPNIGKSFEELEEKKTIALNRNLFIYSVMKVCPLMMHSTLYSEGLYCSVKSNIQRSKGIHKAEGISDTFVKSYTVLECLPNITEINSGNNTFTMMSNDTTHEPCLLQEPEYTPEQVVDNTEYDALHKDRFILNGKEMKMNEINQVIHYQANMAAFIQLGNYFDFLRENGVYDNTRIIIVADHGRNLHQFDDLLFGEGSGEDVMFFNPLFMVKDFNSSEFTIDTQLMTNADTPTIAFSNLIENPINPATKKTINNVTKQNDKLNIFLSFDWSTDKNNGTTFLPGSWYSVHDNIFDINNWEYLPNHE